MGKARTNKSTRKGRLRHNQYGNRKALFQATRPIVTIVFDDSKTAPAYFQALQREVRSVVTLRIIRASHGKTSPRAVVDRAVECSALSSDLRDDEDDRESVWAVIDMEHEPHKRSQAEREKERAEGEGVKVALSDPCFEVWTLLHLENTGEYFGTCARVTARVKALWESTFEQPFDRKARADYTKIIGRRKEAATRAKRHREANDRSWTEVYKIIDVIQSHLPQTEPATST